jgi:hypothetical protein
MKITLYDGTVLNPLVVTGTAKLVQGATRDVISFVFPGDTDLEELDRIFTPEACRTIIITGNGEDYVHLGYIIRAELKKIPVEVVPATEDTDAVYEDRVIISMGQQTHLESQVLSLTDTVDVLVLDSLMEDM